MTKLTQHGGFDDSLEQSVRDELLAEFSESYGEWKSEDFGEVMDAFDFAACQRPNGSVYPIANGAQCRRGTPISIKPGEKHRDIMKKGQRAGLKVRSILEENDRLRAEKGLKRVQGESAIRSLARRLNERMGHGQKPADIKGVKSVDEATKVVRKPEPEASKPRKAAGPQVDIVKQKRGGVHVVIVDGNRVGLMIKQPGDPRYLVYVGGKREQVVGLGMARARARALAKEAKGAPKEKSAKPAVEAEVKKPSQQINKKFLRERTTQKLQAYLNDRKLFPYQRKKIEEELARRAQAGKGVEPQQPASKPKPNLRDRVKARKAAIDEVDKQIEQVRKRRQEPAYQKSENRAFLDSVEKGLIRRRMDLIAGVAPSQAGKSTQSIPKPSKSGPKPYGLDKDLGVMVNKKLLGQDTTVLQRILRERSLNPRQRAKIEEEVAGRGETPASAQRAMGRRGAVAMAKKGGLEVTQVVKGYDPIEVYNNPSNKLLARGAFGAAYRTDGPPPGIIKQGKIGEHEVEVWQKLQGTGRVPEIHGAAVSRNMKEVGAGYGGHVREANGYLGLGVAKGKTVGSMNPTEDERRSLINEYIRARRDIHVAGVAHNDMHANNVFYDRTTGKMQLIDFGLAQPSYKAALMEALTTNQGDWQSERFIGRYMPRGDEPAAYNRFRRNQRSVLRQLENEGIDTGHLMGMGIRNKPEHIDNVLEGMSETAAQSYIKSLYEGV